MNTVKDPQNGSQEQASKARRGKLVLIIGPSGVGKSIILKKLHDMHPELHFPKSATTRERRWGESTDLYYFVSEKEFDELFANGKILEWATVHGGARYGTLIDEIVPFILEGKTVVREVDVQGFMSIKNHPLFGGKTSKYQLISIFILPESEEQLIQHITKRAPMSAKEVQNRMESMKKEITLAKECTEQIINREGKLNETIKKIEKMILD